MGMSASQARFLGLTARKNNVEYEGQQVNQQRTVLGNETANYYNDLLGMSVPIPPSPNDYTKTIYTFEDGSLTNTITSMIAQQDGKYLISYLQSWTDDFAAVATNTSLVTKVEDDAKTKYSSSTDLAGADFTREGTTAPYTYKYKGVELKGPDSLSEEMKTKFGIAATDTTKYYSLEDEESGATMYIPVSNLPSSYGTDGKGTGTVSGVLKSEPHYDYMVGAKKFRTLGDETSLEEMKDSDEYYKTLSEDQRKKLLKEEEEYISILDKQYGDDSKWLVRYELNTSSNVWEPRFTKLNVLNNTIYDENNRSLSYIPMYTVGSAEKNEEIKGVEARFEQDATGRIINITMHPGAPDQVTYAVTTNTVTDQAKYDDAMNQYEYDKALYDKTIQETNAKIEIIQSEDKNLELRLKQLDTEQEAIQTEMDAVQKVVEKNVESSFKTFG